MCLCKVNRTEKLKATRAYKVYEVVKQDTHPPLLMSPFRNHIPRKGLNSLTHEPYDIFFNNFEDKYHSGFHAFLNKKDAHLARCLMDRGTSGSIHIVVQIQFSADDIICHGIETYTIEEIETPVPVVVLSRFSTTLKANKNIDVA
jgi:hypothetical protein